MMQLKQEITLKNTSYPRSEHIDVCALLEWLKSVRLLDYTLPFAACSMIKLQGVELV